MTDEHWPSILSADRPLTDPEDDRLGYSSFAERLPESIATMAPSDGFVVALQGSWGSGKSTLLNFVRSYLRSLPESRSTLSSKRSLIPG